MNNVKIIAIETSGRCGSVALAQGDVVVKESDFPTNREHAKELLPTVDSLCRDLGWLPGEIEQCFLSIGPGSFTGLRVAVTFARHFALATGAKICAVSTLDVIAENGAALPVIPERLAVVLDAKRSQVFAAVYERSCLSGNPCTCPPSPGSLTQTYRRIVEPCMIEPARLLGDAPKPIAVIGEGIEYHRVAVEASGAQIIDPSFWPPQASNVFRLGWHKAAAGQFTPPRMLTPHYLRRPEAEELWEKRHGGGGDSGKDAVKHV